MRQDKPAPATARDDSSSAPCTADTNAEAGPASGPASTHPSPPPEALPPSYTAVLSVGSEGSEGTEEIPYDENADTHWTTSINPQGRIDVSVDLSEAVSSADLAALQDTRSEEEVDLDTLTSDQCPPLNIVIFIVGSRGDVQPYLALALELIRTRGHHVRIATHAIFADMVTEATVHLAGLTDTRGRPLTSRLEHFNIGGSPEELMSYMVRNPGLIPGVSALLNGDIRRKRKMVKQMLQGCYLSCFSPNERTGHPFAADAIISNPPAFAHIHVAEALGIPLIMSFTMPWTPTSEFPHPLVAAKNTHSDKSMNNYASFVLADALMWQGLGDLINFFRYTILGLRPLSLTRGPLVLQRLQIPYTYAWSESLLPKPANWKGNTDVVGFYSLKSDTSRFRPDPELLKFLEAGEPPIYFGFGSVVVDEPDKLTTIILNAVERTGVRALVSAGWAQLGQVGDIPDNVFIIKGNVPHDWLFDEGRVAAVCHHGGAGTTAAGLRLGLPTIIVPFFGDQWFWGNAVQNAGAGPAPIPYSELIVDRLTEAIKVALEPATREAAQAIGQRINAEDGVGEGVKSFHRHLPLLNMRCDVDENQVAVWWSEAAQARLSAGVAAVLVEERVLSWRDLEPHRAADYDATRHYTDPFASFGQSVLNLGAMSIGSTGELFYAPARGLGGLVWGVPKASFDVVSSFQEGLENVPGMMGAHTRKRGKVDSFSSGLAEGGRGLAFGLWDGVTGLVTEPYRGAKSAGVDGFVRGAWNGVMSMGPRLAGAGLGLVVHPATGAFRGARTRLSRSGLLENQSVMYSPRQAASHDAAASVTKEERHAIVLAWARLNAPEAAEARRSEHEARRVAAERRLLAHEDTPLAPVGRRMGSHSWKKEKKGKGKGKRKATATEGEETPRSSFALAESQDQGNGQEGYGAPLSPALDAKDPRWRETHSRLANGEYDQKDPRWSETHAAVAAGAGSPARATGEKDPRWQETHDALTHSPESSLLLMSITSDPSEGSGPMSGRPVRAGTGMSFASIGSGSTAELAMAGTERWGTPRNASFGSASTKPTIPIPETGVTGSTGSVASGSTADVARTDPWRSESAASSAPTTASGASEGSKASDKKRFWKGRRSRN